MIQNLINSNPQYKNAWDITQSILRKGGTKEDMLKSACEKSGANYNSLIDELRKDDIYGKWN